MPLRRVFAGLELPVSERKRDEIRAAVFEYVDRHKAEGWPAERVILAVKRHANDAGFYPTSRVLYDPGPLTGSDAFAADLVRWCIERYLDGLVFEASTG
jgi:hypothetical protein